MAPWFAVLLSIWLPGLGQLYSGYPRRALFWFVTWLTSSIWLLIWIASPYWFHPASVAMPLVLAIISAAGAAIDPLGLRPPYRVPLSGRLLAQRNVLFTMVSPLFGYFAVGYWWLAIPYGAAIVALMEVAKHCQCSDVLPCLALRLVAVPHALWLSTRRLPRGWRSLHMARPLLLVVATWWICRPLVYDFALGGYQKVFKNWKVPSHSMEPTVMLGDRFFSRRTTDIHRGDIIVFPAPGKPKTDFIKRVVGVPGDRIAVRGNRVVLNGRSTEEPYISTQALGRDTSRPDRPTVVVPVGRLFVLGDNRDLSEDSRDFGTIPISSVLGVAYKIYWPPQNARVLARP